MIIPIFTTIVGLAICYEIVQLVRQSIARRPVRFYSQVGASNSSTGGARLSPPVEG